MTVEEGVCLCLDYEEVARQRRAWKGGDSVHMIVMLVRRENLEMKPYI